MTTPKVGDICLVERCFGISRKADHSCSVAIVRITPKRAYLDNRRWFAIDDPERVVEPRYLDYTTRVVRIDAPSQTLGDLVYERAKDGGR